MFALITTFDAAILAAIRVAGTSTYGSAHCTAATKTFFAAYWTTHSSAKRSTFPSAAL